MAKNPESLFQEIKKGNIAPLYFLYGEEPYYIDKIVALLEEKTIPEEQRAFNQVILYGKDSEIPSVINQARRFPVMAERQLIVVKEAQDLPDWKKDQSTTLLTSYVDKPIPSTVLVFAFKKKLDKRLTVFKSIIKHAIHIESTPVKDYQVVDWITNYCKEQGLKINNEAIRLLAENIGSNLSRITSELDKVKIGIGENEEINADKISQWVGISKDYNVFALQKVIANKQSAKAFEIADNLARNLKANPIIVSISSIYNYFTKILQLHSLKEYTDAQLAKELGVNPYFLKEYRVAAKNYPVGKVIQIIKYCKEADLKSKGVLVNTGSESEILRELLIKILFCFFAAVSIVI